MSFRVTFSAKLGFTNFTNYRWKIFIYFYDAFTFFYGAHFLICFICLIKSFNIFVLFSLFKGNLILVKLARCIQYLFTILIGAGNQLKSFYLISYVIFSTVITKFMLTVENSYF